MFEKIFSDYRKESKEALDYFYLHRAPHIILSGLDHFSLEVNAYAAALLKDFDEKDMVPRLIRALESNNYMAMGGSEVQIPHRQLKRNLVIALEHLTGVQIGPIVPDSSRTVQGAIDKFKDWLERNPQD